MTSKENCANPNDCVLNRYHITDQMSPLCLIFQYKALTAHIHKRAFVASAIGQHMKKFGVEFHCFRDFLFLLDELLLLQVYSLNPVPCTDHIPLANEVHNIYLLKERFIKIPQYISISKSCNFQHTAIQMSTKTMYCSPLFDIPNIDQTIN